jgi:glycosyltransferase involved in cell wall biosynthesis
MRIAQVAPLAEAVPPHGYGGTERVISWLTEELVRRGHEVTLFASADSSTKAHLVPLVPRALRLAGAMDSYVVEQALALESVAQRNQAFDIIHYHCDYHHFPWSRRSSVPTVTTLHGRLDLPGLPRIYGAFPEMPLVSISDHQRLLLGNDFNWVTTIHHGMPLDALEYRGEPGEYFAFLGRASEEKGLDRAIAIARALRTPLRVAAKVDDVDRAWFERVIRPLLAGPYVDLIGEIGEDQKSEFLGRAKALLFPIDWPEPFGLVMIEALACGTPVVAFRHGSVPEVLENGKTAFLVGNLEEAIEKAARVDDLDRATCRSEFERRFSAGIMTSQYEAVYERIVADAHARSA